MQNLRMHCRDLPQPGGSPPRVVVLSDHPLVRHGLRRLLAQHEELSWVADADCSDAGVKLVAEQRADLVVVDISQPIRSALACVRRLRASRNDVRILAMATQPEWLLGMRALRAGANGFVHKGEPLDELILAVNLTAQGRGYIAQSALSRLVDKSVAAPDGHPLLQLSDYELDVFYYLADGVSISRIKEQLNITDKAVRNYKSRVMRKLGLDASGFAQCAASLTGHESDCA